MTPASPDPKLPPLEPPAPHKTVSLWAGVLGSPALWGIHMQLDYALVPTLCGHGGHLWVLHVLAGVFAVLSAFTFVLCWREWHAMGASTQDDAVGGAGRTIFLSALGMMTAALFTLVIIAQGIASFFINPCWD